MTLMADGITVARGGRTLLDHVSVRLEPGRLTAILGPNGAGKSTLLRALAGDIRPGRGRVCLDGRDIAGLSPERLALRRAVLPQDVEVSFPFPAREVVGWGARTLPRRQAEAFVAGALDALEAGHLAGRPITRLSGGERRRVHLARALVQVRAIQAAGSPPILLLDEPTAALDPRHQHLVLRLVAMVAAEGAAVMAVLHDLDLAARHAGRLVLMDGGTVAAEGPAEAVLTPPLLRRVYGIDSVADRCPRTGALSVRVVGCVAPRPFGSEKLAAE